MTQAAHMTSFRSGRRQLEGYMAGPEGDGSFPGSDFTAKHGQKLDVELDRYNVPHDIKIYPGAKHGFFNDTLRNYDEVAAQDSWERVLAFFEERLGAKESGNRF